jgi:hypothetical protein
MAKPDFKKDERVVLAPGTHRAGQQATVISVQPGSLLPWSVRIRFDDGEVFNAAPFVLTRL